MKEIHFVSADEAVKAIKSGDHIHLSSVASVPHILVDALVRRAEAGEIEDLHFHHFHTEGPAPYSDPKNSGIFFEQGVLRRAERAPEREFRVRGLSAGASG